MMQQGQGQGQASKDMHRLERACSAYRSDLLPLKAGAWWTFEQLPCLEAPACNTLQQPLCSACQNPASLSWPPDMLTRQQEQRQELSVNFVQADALQWYVSCPNGHQWAHVYADACAMDSASRSGWVRPFTHGSLKSAVSLQARA